MADTVKKTKATAKAAATPKQASAKNVKVAELAKPATERKGIELVPKFEGQKKSEAAPAKSSKTATKKESVVVSPQPRAVSRENIEQVAYQIWIQLGHRHGHALEEWLMAERALLERAS